MGSRNDLHSHHHHHHRHRQNYSQNYRTEDGTVVTRDNGEQDLDRSLTKNQSIAE